MLRRVYLSQSLESVHEATSLGDVCSGVNQALGPPAEIDAFVQSFRDLRLPPHILETRLLDHGPRRATWYSRWRRPAAGDGFSPEHIALDHLGPGAFVWHRARPGEIVLRLASEHAEALDSCARALEAILGERYFIRRLYAGDFRVDDDAPPALAPEDAALLRTALRMGYYDSPRRSTLEDLSRALGRSKSTVCERLKALEGNAVQSLLGRLGDRSALPASEPLSAMAEESVAFGGK